MNVVLSLTLHPKNIKEEWNWCPKVDYKSWPIKSKDMKNVWYFNFRWFNTVVCLDNE